MSTFSETCIFALESENGLQVGALKGAYAIGTVKVESLAMVEWRVSLSFLVCDLRISALIPWKIIVAMTMEWVNLSIRGVRRGNSHNKQILNYVKQLIFSKYVNLYKIQKAQSSLLYFLTFSFLA